MATIETIREPAKDIPVFRRCDVLVVGGGPAGSAAAASAARMGADTILVERYIHEVQQQLRKQGVVLHEVRNCI